MPDGRLQHGARLRHRSRCAAGRAQGRRRRVVHRFGRRRPATSRRAPRSSSSARRSNSAASRRTSSSPTPTSTSGAGRGDVDLHERRPGVRRRVRASSCSGRSTTSFSTRSQRPRPAWKPGDPFDRTTRLGPLVSQAPVRPRDGLPRHRRARKAASCSAAVARPESTNGYYVAPTAIVDVDNSARVCQEEIFGPVAVIMPFDERRRCAAHRQRFELRPRRLHLDRIADDRALRQPPVADRDDLDQRRLRARSAPAVRRRQESGTGREGGGHSREFYTETRFASFPLTPR